MNDDIIAPRCPKLVEYGPRLSKRFREKPTLYPQQKQALEKLVEWFTDDSKKDYTAVVCMPTGTGKTGVICCLPYYLGGANIPDIDFLKPILVIAPGLSIMDQLQENLDSNAFLMREHIGLIKPEEKHCG